jgi:hypothetical protein
LHQELKASIVIRELIVKLLQRVNLALHGTPSLSKKEYNTKCTCCQGIVTFFYARDLNRRSHAIQKQILAVSIGLDTFKH